MVENHKVLTIKGIINCDPGNCMSYSYILTGIFYGQYLFNRMLNSRFCFFLKGFLGMPIQFLSLPPAKAHNIQPTTCYALRFIGY